MHERRPSQQVIDKEKKTDYWKDVAAVARTSAVKQGGDVSLDNVISRAMSLGVVGDKKQRESMSAPKTNELLQKVAQAMEKRVTELGGQKLDDNTPLMDKIFHLESTLATLEAKKTKEEEEEKARVQSKIVELENSLKNLQVQKVEQREQNRQTMKLEIATLKEMMAKVQQEQTETANNNASAMASKVSRLEAALRLLNEERKKEQVDDKDSLLLKRKLALFEQKLKEMEAEKKIQEESDNSEGLREKLSLMEDKLAKMERRKSQSLTADLQNKMDTVEKQLSLLRSERSNGHPDAINNKIAQKCDLLEKHLRELATQQQKIVVNDPETEVLRSQISKLEESIVGAEKRMEDQRKKIEEERRKHHEARIAEEQKFRQQSVEKERELIKRLESMEVMMKSGGGGANPAIAEQLSRLEQQGGSGNPLLQSKMKEMEQKLALTQKSLESERMKNKEFFALVPKESSGLESWQKYAQLAWLQKTHQDLLSKFQTTQQIVDKKIEELKHMQSTGGGGPAAGPQSGLSYAEINAKLAEIQGQLFDPNIDERESERLNIEYEKLITELEGTDEYKKEQEQTREKWKKDNEGPNRAAYEQVCAQLSAMQEPQKSNFLKKKPELKFLLKTPDQINKAHVNDFKQVSTQNLSLAEARALYHNMPDFRKDQEQQLQFLVQLQAKIETEMSKPQVAAPPPIAPKKKVVIKKNKNADSGGGGGGGGGFLDELLAKRKRKE